MVGACRSGFRENLCESSSYILCIIGPGLVTLHGFHLFWRRGDEIGANSPIADRIDGFGA
jgi:hypothetical protein